MIYRLAVLAVLPVAVLLAGCGGGSSTSTTVSGAVADINRNVLVGARVYTGAQSTRSLVAGTYRLNGAPSGWRTIRAEVEVDGDLWVGSTAVEVLRDEPTFNANIVMAPARDTALLTGTVRDSLGRTVSGARVLLTTRITAGSGTSAFDGPYSSIVDITDSSGRYRLEDVPAGLDAVVAASKVGYLNDEHAIFTSSSDDIENFSLSLSDLPPYNQEGPELAAIESYTMPDQIAVRSRVDAYKAIKAFTSERYRKVAAKAKKASVRATPEGSLIEVDLYWNGLDLNNSDEVAGYGIYRNRSGNIGDLQPIDFIRDPYANFYGDTGIELTPGQLYYYAVTSVDVQFLDNLNDPDPTAESEYSNLLSVRPLGQLTVTGPADNSDQFDDPVFACQPLSRADTYTVYVYSAFPALPLDPGYDYGSDPVVDAGIFPIWPASGNLSGSTTSGTSIQYDGPALVAGRRYYWVVLAIDSTETAFSYSELRSFIAR